MRIVISMARPTTGRNGTRVNLYLQPELREEAQRVAKARYGTSLSDMVERLLREELKLKRGKLHRAA
jgi:hypothetical protein